MFQLAYADGAAVQGIPDYAGSIRPGWIIGHGTCKAAGVFAHFLPGSILVGGLGQQDGVGDAAALHMGKAGAGIAAEVEMSVEDRTTPGGFGLGPDARGGQGEAAGEEGSSLHSRSILTQGEDIKNHC